MKNKYLNDEQLKMLMSTIERRKILRDEVIFKLGLYLGLRVQEICNIKLEDIDPENRAITIQGIKGGRLRTYSDIEESLWKKLNRYSRAIKSAYLFPSSRNSKGKLTTMAIQRLFKFYMKQAGLPEHFSIHSLRHTCGIIRAKANQSPIKIMLWLRQRSISSTQTYFEQVVFERDAEQANEEFKTYL